MANSNQIELVVTVEVDKANKSIKSVNANLSSIEAAATRSARAASSGIDGMTASMVKGATAGSLLADGIKKVLGWVKDLTIETAKYAARTDVLAMVTQQLAKVNNVSASGVSLLVERIKELGITTQEAHGVIQRMIFAELDLGKAAQLADVARNAAVIAGVDTSQALENIILGITTGQTRLLHNMGLQVSLLNVEAAAAKELGHQLTDQEKREAMLNAVLKEGVKIRGTYPAAMELVGKQMTSLPRYFKEAANAVGENFQPALKKVVDTLKELAFWLKDNSAQVADFAKVLAGLVAAGAVGLLATKIWGLVGALQALGAAAMANPIGLIAAGVALAGGIIYSEWRRMKQSYEEMDATYQKWITSQITGAKTGADLKSATEKVEKAFEAGTIDAKQYAQALDMLDAAKARVYGWGDLSDVTKNLGLKITIKDPKKEAEAAKALAEEVGKAQLANEKTFRDRALEAGKTGLTGFAKDVADINAEIQKRTVFVDQQGQTHRFSLTRKAWDSIIDEMRLKLQAFKDHFAEENRKALADYLKDEEAAAKKQLDWEAKTYQQRLQHEVEISDRSMDNLKAVYAFQEDRAGFERDARLRELDSVDARTIQQKVAVEQQKAQIEIEYLQKVHEVKQALYDIDTRRMLLEEELTLKRLGYNADEIRARIADLKQERQNIRGQADEANDNAVRAARENAANRTAEMVRQHNQQIFESLKQQAGGVFDALLQKSQSVWSAIGNSFKTAILTAIKEVVTSRVAAMLMQLFTGQKVSFAGGGAGPGGSGGMLGGLGGLLGIGAVPVFAGTAPGGGVVPGVTPGTTPPFVPGGGGLTSKAGAANLFNWQNIKNLASWKNLYSAMTLGGGLMMLSGVQRGSALSTIGGGALMGAGIGLSGGPIGAVGGAGIGLFADAMRRGGGWGVAEGAAGGAMFGWNVGGPLGALIGAGVGALAGVVRLFVKGATEKARQKVKDLYGVDISDKAVLQQIVDMAKQSCGGNLDMAIRTQQVRDLIQLYAMSTGQQTKGMPATVHPLDVVQTGGSLYQSPGYNNGTVLPGLGGLPTLDSIGGGVASGAQPVVIQLDGPATTSLLQGQAVRAIASNPRVVQGAVMSASKSNSGRRELTSLQLSPGLVTS